MTMILAFGDSITYGACDIQGGWVQRLRKYLDEKQLNNPELYYLTYNLGVSGETSKRLLDRLESEVKRRIKLMDEVEEVIIIISIGVNDSKFNNKTKKNDISIKEYISNVQSILDISKKYSSKIVFVGSTPIDEKLVDPMPWREDFSYKSIFIENYNEAAAKVCNENNISFIETYNKFKEIKNYKKLLTDGVHPSSEGHKIFFEMIKNYLIKEKII